jgi:hypothetical protein
MDTQPEGQSGTLAHCVHPTTPWVAGVWHTSDWVTLPQGCVSVRGTVTPEQAVRSDPQMGCSLQLIFQGGDGRIVNGSGCEIPSRDAFDPDELTPTAGHEAGQPPGVLPSMSGVFAFVVQESPGVQQGPYRPSVAMRFRLTLGDASTVSAGVTVEAFGADDQPLEIT